MTWREVLLPWSVIRTCRRALLDDAQMIVDLREEAGRLSRKLVHTQRERDEAFRQLGARPTLGPAPGRLLSPPEFVLTGTDRGNGLGKRVYASRDLPAATFSIPDGWRDAPSWQLTALLDNMLTVDAPEYGEAMARVMTIWANRDAEKRGIENAEAANRSRYQPGHGYLVPAEPAAIEQAGDDHGSREQVRQDHD